ncbi:MAG: hypothetical protein ACRDRZ_05485 [Pseudonocardiaceae bacterium]
MAEDDGPPARPFADWLAEQGKGRLHEELTAKFAELIAAVQHAGKGGEICLRIKVKPQPKMDGRMVLVEDDVTVKPPALERPTSLFFIDGAGLVRDDPDQLPLHGLRDVSARRADDDTTRQSGRARA